MRTAGEIAVIAQIADDLAAGIWVATAPDGRFVYANRAFEEIMGMGPVASVAVGEYAQPYGIFARSGEPYPEARMPSERRAAAALARIAHGERFDAIVCDLMMPDMTGMDLHERLRAVAPDQVRVMLFLTGGAFTPRARAFLSSVDNATLEKPCAAHEILRSVRRIVG
ncbi:MAG: response regulator [Myxococcales bacterium]|nr:response regulator [Myxococcales bacterium]